ncbi:BQ5605_C010g06174 [Microbotryum silenes-dioicae]|uniref:BQ5605_C010g06174 protein n=1 Tax=Microbotryum silenes-dioicae TaxID=796604 RepID=A0A2X0MJZ3_9BASI|nr:BQ5605_C010g06174 [Microbotryum silenes-dioicae]
MLLKLTFTLALTLVSLGVSASQSNDTVEGRAMSPSSTKSTVTSPAYGKALKTDEVFSFVYKPAEGDREDGFFQITKLSLKAVEKDQFPIFDFANDLSSAQTEPVSVDFRLPPLEYFNANTVKTAKTGDSIEAILEISEQNFRKQVQTINVPLTITLHAHSQ